MNETMIETDVLVVGGGPVGLSLALELGLQGRRCLVAEQNDRAGVAPRAKCTNIRSRELMRRWGIAERLAEASPFGIDYPSNVVFATRLAGYELARFENGFYCSPERDERFSEHGQWIPQYKVEVILGRRAGEFPGVEIRLSTQLESWTEDAEGVTAQLIDTASGETFQVRAAYLVGADGARSTVRERLGIEMEGISPLGQFHNIVFRSPGLSRKHALGPAIMYWLVNGEVPAVVAPLDAGDVWTFGCPKLANADADPTTLIRAALGMGDIEVEIVNRDHWTAHQLIARAYRAGRAFLAGDACHLHPPFGGHGMNMGIGDAVDLGWKLSAVLKGWGGEALLDSYEIERRQVHRRVVDEAVENNSRSSRSLVVEGIEADGPAGDAVRAGVKEQILIHKPQEFLALNVVLGSRLVTSPVLAADDFGTPAPLNAGAYVPSANPGSLAPHVWLAEGKARGASLYDHFAVEGLTLLVTNPQAMAAAETVAQAARAVGVPLRVIAPESPTLHALYEADMALIRPDQFIAWRGNCAADASKALLRAAGREVINTTLTETQT
jgi:2-polyprenyl-6-methoxyphenol hydroxylase-like FAD-dependent oxidoreductase